MERKRKKSILNAIFALLQMFITGVFGLILSRNILIHYGSDYNGVNSIVTQIVNVIMLLEGGFTLASNVALFRPFMEKNINKINCILSATGKRFRTVSLIAVLIGIIVSFAFPFCISTKLSYITCVCMMISVLLPACFNLGYSMKYRVILLADQKEYVISFISALFYAMGNIAAVVVIQLGYSILIMRLTIMMFLFFSYYMIGRYCKKHYGFARFDVQPEYGEIAGAKYVLALKVTSMLYNSIPIVLISTLPEMGTMLASVYAVYKHIMVIVSQSLTAVTNAPRLSFGAMFAEGNLEYVSKLFTIYEKITFIALSIVLGTTCLLILPFVDLYTSGVNDINYHDTILACIMLLTVFFEVCHIPSGQIIQMSGNFKASQNIQIIAFVFLVGGMVIGRITAGMYGILTAVLVAALVLCVLEISYTGIKIFKRRWLTLITNVCVSLMICTVAGMVGWSGVITCTNYCMFVVESLLGGLIISLITFGVFYIIDASIIKYIMEISKSLLLNIKYYRKTNL